MAKKSKSSSGSGVSVPSSNIGSQSGFYQASQGAGLIGGLINSFTSPFLNNRSQRIADYNTRRQMAIQHGYNLEMMAYQYDLNKRAFDYANEYNLPVNQVRRLMEAGINPASLSGMGEGGSMSASSALGGSMGSPGIQRYGDAGFSALAGAASQAMLTQSQVNVNNAQARYLSEQSDTLLPVMADMYKTLANKYDKDSGLADAQSIYQRALNTIIEDTMDEQKRGVKLRNDLTLAQVNNTIANTQKSFLESEDLRFKIENLNDVEYQQALADLQHTQAAACLAYAQKALTEAGVQYSEQALQNLVAERTKIEYESGVLFEEQKFLEESRPFRVAQEGWKARTAKREYRWLPWKNFSSVTGSIISSVMSVYSKGKSGALQDSQTELNKKYLNDSGAYDFEEEIWYDPSTNTRHRSHQSRRY